MSKGGLDLVTQDARLREVERGQGDRERNRHWQTYFSTLKHPPAGAELGLKPRTLSVLSMIM